MKALLGEIVDPIKDFFKMRTKEERILSILVPILSGLACFLVGLLVHPIHEFDLISFGVDILNQLLTILTLFISFSMAYLSILISSGSKNVDGLKGFYTGKYFLDGKECTLYQVLASEITYTIIFEILFMVFVLIQRLLLYIFTSDVVQIVLSIDIACFVHTLLMMLVVIKNIYYSFWRSK